MGEVAPHPVAHACAAAPPKKPIGRHIVPTFPQQFTTGTVTRLDSSGRFTSPASLKRDGVGKPCFTYYSPLLLRV